MRVLVIGSGGCEHAICQAFSKNPPIHRNSIVRGNAGISRIAECVPINSDDVSSLASFASSNHIDLTFVGGDENGSALGVVDEFTA